MQNSPIHPRFGSLRQQLIDGEPRDDRLNRIRQSRSYDTLLELLQMTELIVHLDYMLLVDGLVECDRDVQLHGVARGRLIGLGEGPLAQLDGMT